MFLDNVKLIRDIETIDKSSNEIKNDKISRKESLKKRKRDSFLEISSPKKKLCSPKTREQMRKNKSWDNFMKIQWPWIA